MKILILGDSISQGLGSKKINFCAALNERVGEKYNIINLAHTGTTINYALQLIPTIEEINPNIVIIQYGSVDVQIRPNRNGKIYSHLPKRFKMNNGSMLLPRPFYSSRRIRNYAEHIENCFRTFFRKSIYLIDGTEQWVSKDEFYEKYTILCSYLKERGFDAIACSTMYIDERLFPASQKEYKDANTIIASIAKRFSYKYLDFFESFQKLVQDHGWDKYFNKDHFHPNRNGYIVMANLLAQIINEINEKND